MKKLILVSCLQILTLVSFAQIKDTVGLNLQFKDGKLHYEGVVEIPGKSKDELYKNAKLWFVNYFNNANFVIQLDDPQEGKIVGKGAFRLYFKSLMTFQCLNNLTIQIDCKDGKYRYKFYDMVITAPMEYNRTRDIPAEYFVNKLTGIKPAASYTKSQSEQIVKSNSKALNDAITSIRAITSQPKDEF